MPLKYSVIEIYSNEEARSQGIPVAEAVVRHIRGLKIAARCIVTRGIQGCYENGEEATQSILDLSFNMPLKIEVVLPAAGLPVVLPAIEEMIREGIVLTREMEIRFHKTRKCLLPRQFRVKDIMTPSPQTVALNTPVSDVARLLLSSVFTGVPVVDEKHHPVGIITQGNLIYQGGMPMRIGLLAAASREKMEAALSTLASREAEEIMSRPVISIGEDEFVTEAANRMIHKNVKRLPVVDAHGRLAGMLSRLDIFRAAMKESPDWKAFQGQKIKVGNIQQVSDIMRRDIHVVSPDTPVEEVIRLIDTNDIQRVAVVDESGVFLGLISDRDLLTAFVDEYPGIWDFFVSKIPFTERGRKQRELCDHLRASTAREVMKTGIITVREDTLLDEALTLMAGKAIKRLPVLDGDGKFKGMISRDSLLRTGFGKGAP